MCALRISIIRTRTESRNPLEFGTPGIQAPRQPSAHGAQLKEKWVLPTALTESEPLPLAEQGSTSSAILLSIPPEAASPFQPALNQWERTLLFCQTFSLLPNPLSWGIFVVLLLI